MEIEKMITLSTRYIKESTAEALDDACDRDIFNISTSLHFLSVYRKSEYGWFIAVPENGDSPLVETGLEDLDACMKLAYDNGCRWLCLDRDGDEADGLTEYCEW